MTVLTYCCFAALALFVGNLVSGPTGPVLPG